MLEIRETRKKKKNIRKRKYLIFNECIIPRVLARTYLIDCSGVRQRNFD